MTDLRARVMAELTACRERSEALTSVLTEDDLRAQHSSLMSPFVWDLAHVANYEELWLARAAGRLVPFRPELDQLYDAFAHPRDGRAALPILGPAEARAYARATRARALDALDHADLDPGAPLTGAGFVHSMVFQHEQQHDETMLATHQLRSGSAVLAESATVPAGCGKSEGGDVLIPGGPATMGTSIDPWAWDNERPAHAVNVPPFRIDVLPVSNAQFAEFIFAGGYDDPHVWSPQGWAHRTQAGLTGPEFWTADGGGWFTRTRFGRVEAVPPNEPVQHVGYHEAMAYARWRGRRLPTEQEWEKACGWDPLTESGRKFPWGAGDPTPELANLALGNACGALRPAEVGAYPAGASAYGVQQLIGDVWEWTSSPFRAYPGYRPYPYDEYSQVFFGPEFRVLRGGSWATHPTVARTTFRNWDYPIRRQIFAGFRTAVSA